jgi:hypothetical protein
VFVRRGHQLPRSSPKVRFKQRRRASLWQRRTRRNQWQASQPPPHLSNASSQHLLMICTEYCPETTSQRHTSLHPGPVSVNSLQTGEVWTKVHRSITLQTCSVPTPRNFCNRCEFDAALTALIGAQSNNLLPFTPSTLLIADIRQQALALATFERVLQRLSSGRFRPTPAWSSASRPPPIR